MDIVQRLRISVSVVDNGGFARAAEALHMGRPSVTNAVALGLDRRLPAPQDDPPL